MNPSFLQTNHIKITHNLTPEGIGGAQTFQVQHTLGFFRWSWATLLTVPLGRASDTWISTSDGFRVIFQHFFFVLRKQTWYETITLIMKTKTINYNNFVKWHETRTLPGGHVENIHFFENQLQQSMPWERCTRRPGGVLGIFGAATGQPVVGLVQNTRGAGCWSPGIQLITFESCMRQRHICWHIPHPQESAPRKQVDGFWQGVFPDKFYKLPGFAAWQCVRWCGVGWHRGGDIYFLGLANGWVSFIFVWMDFQQWWWME